MAVAEVSAPSILHTALRNVEYTFSMSDPGSPPIQKYLMYRLKNVTDNTYLTEWKFYRPVDFNQQIKIDFSMDLFGIVKPAMPQYWLVGGVTTTTDIIKRILVEFAERTVDTEACTVVDSAPVESTNVDVINGIFRPYETILNSVGMLLTERPFQYSVSKDTHDWVYVSGTTTIRIEYYNEAGTLINTLIYTTTQTHPGSNVKIIPCGFQNAPAGTTRIRVRCNLLETPENIKGIAFTVLGNVCACDNGEVRDIYFVNNRGGVDAMSFDCVSAKDIQISKQYLTRKFDEGVDWRAEGQQHVSGNQSRPSIRLKRSFDYITYKESRWLDECAASGTVWMREQLPSGVNVLVRMNIVDSTPVTYISEEDVEFELGLTYSEEFLFPY